MLKFHRDIVWSFHYSWYLFLRCSSSERSLNYATKMARILQLSTCEEQRSVVRFLWAKGHKPSDIHRDMRGLYGDDCMDRSNVSRWCTFFEEESVNLSDSPRSGRPTTAATPQNVRGIEAAILNDRRVQLRASTIQSGPCTVGLSSAWFYEEIPGRQTLWDRCGSEISSAQMGTLQPNWLLRTGHIESGNTMGEMCWESWCLCRKVGKRCKLICDFFPCFYY